MYLFMKAPRVVLRGVRLREKPLFRPRLGGLPHLPGVPHLHINRPLTGVFKTLDCVIHF